ncbi:MAG: hypothetical protein GOVbin1096_1 [Prokaryotic dsDNA virus sp.]|jgi:hypothetical protein|nr:MAG: hypothetical protein GOVbin1096_1 [Prokaryotic dsDNA virus sp.]|tara:strand:- start:36303 stop:36728 length:426 start_codon:yes stop_codon:yes gene_type:complete
MKVIIDFISTLDNDDYNGIFIAFPFITLVILGIAGGIEAAIVGQHAWITAVFVTTGFYLIGGAAAISIAWVGSVSKSENYFVKNVGFYLIVVGFLFTVVTILITLWQIHWILGGVVTLVGLILGTGLVISIIIESKKEESE